MSCKGCQFYFNTSYLQCCDYYIITGQRRGCSVENCTRKVIGKKIPTIPMPRYEGLSVGQIIKEGRWT